MDALLIIGAGGHGRVVAEIAEALGYEKIGFLDDIYKKETQNVTKIMGRYPLIGKMGDMGSFLGEYQQAFCGIGNNRKRAEILDKLERMGYDLPSLIHPTAYVSKTATVREGCIVEPKAILNAGSTIGRGVIISVGAIIDHDVVIDDFSHANAGAIVKAGGRIEKYQKVEAGEIVLGYVGSTNLEAAKPKADSKADSNCEFAVQYKKMTGEDVSFF